MVIHACKNLPDDKKNRLIEILNMKTTDKNLILEAINLI